jgi:hypothetical protein
MSSQSLRHFDARGLAGRGFDVISSMVLGHIAKLTDVAPQDYVASLATIPCPAALVLSACCPSLSTPVGSD